MNNVLQAAGARPWRRCARRWRRLAGCGGGSGSDSSTVTVAGRRADRLREARQHDRHEPDRRHAVRAPGGDLMIREKSSPSAPEHNVTARVHAGRRRRVRPRGLVRRQEDRLLDDAARRRTRRRSTAQPACTGRWNIWEYDMTTGGLDRRHVPPPHQLDRPTTTSTRPTCRPAAASCSRRTARPSRRSTRRSATAYFALDEYERERVLNLHTMDADGGDITQISFNQSHDRNPVVRAERRHHVLALGARRRRATASRSSAPSPTAPTCSCSTARRARATASCIRATWTRTGRTRASSSSSLMSLSGTQEGGALMFIDAANYSEQNTPANSHGAGAAAARAR